MSNEKYALSPAAVEAINNMFGTYSAPFWDGILEVSGTLDTVRKIKSVLEALYSTGKITEAYNLILAIYDVIAIETPASVMNCFKGTVLKNDTVTGDGFPMLKPGTTTVACAGNVQRIEVIPRWCCL